MFKAQIEEHGKPHDFNPDLNTTKNWFKRGRHKENQLYDRSNGEYSSWSKEAQGAEHKATLKLFEYSKEKQAEAQFWIVNLSGECNRYDVWSIMVNC